MAARAAEEAEALRRALEDESKAHARFESIPWKEWRLYDAARKKAAKAAAEAMEAADTAEAAAMAASKEAAPVIISFRVPFRREDVFKELQRFDDPLDYPASRFHLNCVLKTGREFEPSNSSGAGLYDTTRKPTAFAPGLVRKAEPRNPLRFGQKVVWELIEVRSPEMLHWRIQQQAGELSPIALVGEDLDVTYKGGAREYTPAPGQARLPELLIQLQNAPFGTLVKMHVGLKGRLDLSSAWWGQCFGAVAAPLIGCMQAAALQSSWEGEMLVRGYRQQRPSRPLSYAVTTWKNNVAAAVSSTGRCLKATTVALLPPAHAATKAKSKWGASRAIAAKVAEEDKKFNLVSLFTSR
jgi:hypothetical protein